MSIELEIRFPHMNAIRRAMRKPPRGQTVPLEHLVKPASLLNELTRRGRLTEAERRLEPVLKKTGIAGDPHRQLYFRLALFCEWTQVRPEHAITLFLENVYCQYLCEMPGFTWKFPGNLNGFLSFREKLAQAVDLRSVLAETFEPPKFAPPEEIMAPPKYRLADFIDPLNPTVVSAEMFPAEAYYQMTRSLPRNDLYFRLALLSWYSALSPEYALAAFESNPYWQYFCGNEYFTSDFRGDPQSFCRYHERLQGLRTWTGITSLHTENRDIASRIAYSGHPFAMAVHELLTKRLKDPEQQILPLEWNLRIPHATADFWDDFSEALRKWEWKTPESGSPDVSIVRKSSVAGRVIFHTAGPFRPYERLDFALSEVSGLEQLLGDEKAKNNYYLALKSYFGEERFPRAAYNAILNQLQVMVQKVPELEARLWEPASCGKEFSIKPRFAGYGRQLNPGAFVEYWEHYRESLVDASFKGAKPDQFAELIAKITEVTRDFEGSNDKGGARTRRANASEFYRGLRTNLQIPAIASFLLYHYLRSDDAETVFATMDADVILEFLRELRQEPEKVLSFNGFANVPFWISEIREKIPSLQDLLAQKEVFMVSAVESRSGKLVPLGRMRAVAYRFRPATRKLHAIWRGVVWKECMGGDVGNITHLMPERWANMVIENTKLYFVERAGKYLGAVQLTPVLIGGNRHWSLDSDWPHFFNRIGTVRDGELKSTSVFDVWLDRYEKIVVGNSELIHRFPYELELLQQSRAYREGTRIGGPKDVQFGDPIAQRIVQASKESGFGAKYRKSYGDSILIDATIADAGSLVLLKNQD